MLLESPSEFLHFAVTWPGFDSRTRDSFTTSPTEPSVVHVCTITSLEIHFAPQSHSSHPYSCHQWCTRDFPCQRPWPISCTNTSVHTKRPQLCCSMLSRSAPCRNSLYFLLMSFDDSTRGLVVFTFSLLPPSQVWSVRCRLGSNCESFFDSCSVGIDSSCTGGTVLSLST